MSTHSIEAPEYFHPITGEQSRTDFFNAAVRTMLEDNIEYVLTGQSRTHNVEVLHLLGRANQYASIYLAITPDTRENIHGVILPKSVYELDESVRPSFLPLPTINNLKKAPSGQRHYRVESNHTDISINEIVPNGGGVWKGLRNKDPYFPGTYDQKAEDSMNRVREDLDEVSRLEPVKAMSITRSFLIKDAQLY